MEQIFSKSLLYLFYLVLFFLLLSCNKKDDEISNTMQIKYSIIRSEAWKTASTPLHQQYTGMFPEGSSSSGLAFRKNVAKIAWYHVAPLFYNISNLTPNHIINDVQQRSNHYVRGILFSEFYPEQTQSEYNNNDLICLNLAYYPHEKGSYNYDSNPNSYSSGVNPDGSLANPASRWGGIMRDIPLSLFLYEGLNIATFSIEFWMMDPFIYESFHSGGDFYINIGLISEDLLRDGRMSAENSLPTVEIPTNVDTTIWGRVPHTYSDIFAFSNNPSDIVQQDVGLDGLNNSNEQSFFYENYLSRIESLFGTESLAFQKAFSDPSSDDYQYYRGSLHDLNEVSILDRYKNYNCMDGNSPTYDQSPEAYNTAATMRPDFEDINCNFSLDATEAYYQYRISLRPNNLVVGTNYIVESKETEVLLVNGNTERVKWYKFSVPVLSPERQVFGSITEINVFNSMRIFFKNFESPIVCRFVDFNISSTEKVTINR